MVSRKIVAVLVALGLSLTGCANGPNSSGNETISTIGFTGNDLASIDRDTDMEFVDQKMMEACAGLNAYLTKELKSADGSTENLDADSAKAQLRDTTLASFNSISATNPEVSVFADGVSWELISPGKNTEGFSLFSKLCKTYNEVFLRIQENYAEPITLYGACWSQPGMYASLQEKIGETWIFLQEEKSISKLANCSQAGFHYSAEFDVPRYKSDSTRTFRMTFRNQNGSLLYNGKRSWSTPERTIDSTTISPMSLY